MLNESENNEAIAGSFVEGWIMENYLDLSKLFADIWSYLEMPGGRSFTGKETVKNYATATLYKFPDTHTEVVLIIATDKWQRLRRLNLQNFLLMLQSE